MVATTIWESFEDITAFGGDDAEAAVVAPAAQALFASCDARVKHYEVELNPRG